MSNSSLHLSLRAPTPSPTQLSLSFCEPTPRDLKRWIAVLPKANLGETARLLYQALGELNHLLTPSENRLQLLELLRPEVYYVCKNLERHFLSQAIVLDERPRKVANLCQALQNQLAAGYKQIIVRISPRFSKDRTTLLATATQRALHSLNGTLIRASQLYCPVPEGLWLELHQIYLIARHHHLQNIAIPDPLASHTKTLSTEQTYVVAVLLGCSRCNQMRQLNIGRLAEVLEPWSRLVKLQSPAEATSLFAVAQDVDAPPRYKSLYLDQQLPSLLGINPLTLAATIKGYLDLPVDKRAGSELLVPHGFSLDLLQHLSAAWGDVSERTFQRTAGQGLLTLCIGMSALHYYLGGQKSFSEMLKIPAANKAAQFHTQLSITATPDVWSAAFDGARESSAHPYEEIEYEYVEADGGDLASNAQHSFPTFALSVINHSPGGYCLAWPKEVPSQLQAGEMVGIQDGSGQGWSIAVVRWIRQVRSGGTQMGIELVAPFAQPCGLQLMRNTDPASPYLRALLLPEVRAIDQPATLLAPRLPFQEGLSVMINNSGDEHRAALGKRRTGTGSFNQFEYKTIELPRKPQSLETAQEEEFDSLWTLL
ncbi:MULTISPECIES: molecular chaperone [unclassified Pseudomonas]|uniref:molecular chaperone n=1 Tax=unclassified Pseudomonas TaxID=196821 RepID=UPI002AC9A04C|nr:MULTISPECIES: molecular chaperone [unclassified Pseudomonas]MEB0042609.1 molecular chaperone [Pseudomonas sp. MH10]MEB0079194.1 molecular chaperone [Pseudomonas sp. MH10out]MEB0094205.1 molecular chaperone [Pseudomonas sp. CCI4.2]MEB0104246.1 molecular chaperone [Pseudomonas sp. CCI3.2]MEB0122821.1 molecular chaperone [Pseudomonas sp. CCI1.2]